MSFERDVRPLFRQIDVDAMSFAIDLSSYEDVRTNAHLIYERVSEGSMPCDYEWPAESVELFARWLGDGTPP